MNLGPVYFLKAAWLWALIALPVLYWLGVLAARRRERTFERFVSSGILPKVAPELDWKLPKRKFRYWMTALAFFALSLARPQWGTQEETVRTTGLDVMVVLDVSRSMETEDVVPNRLKQSKHFVRTLAERIPGDRLGIVAFAGSAHLSSPLTTDHDYVLEILEGLTPDSVGNQGTDIGAALETAARALDRGAEQLAAPESQIPSSRVVLLISDGEDNEAQIADGAKKVKDAQIRLAVVGVGTEKGGPIPIRDMSGQTYGHKRDREGQTVISRFNPASLQKLAQDSGGRYWQMTPGKSEIDDIVSDLNSLAKGEFSDRRVTIRQERFQIPLALAIFFLLLELTSPARKILAGMALVGFLVAPGTAGADATLRGFLENRRGLESFKDEKSSEAKRHFGNAQVENPLLPEFQFNTGTVQLKEENFGDAARAFSSAAEEADRRADFETAAKARFNQGVALFHGKDFDGAAEAYLRALEANQKRPDPELDRDIRRNLEFLYQAKQQQQQGGKEGESKDQDQESQSDENKSGDQANSGQQKEKKDQEKEGEGDDKKNQPPKQYQTTGKREFKSAKLSPEDAKRVLSELAQKEKELQKKMERMKGRPQGLEKDW